MPIIIQQKEPENPIKLRNKTKPGDLGLTTVTISMPFVLKLKLDAELPKGKDGKPRGRSAFICRLIRQYLKKKQEDDPRFLLQEKQKELEQLKTIYELEKLKLETEIKKLEEEAQKKMKELLE